MTEAVNTSPETQAASLDEAAILTQARAEQAGAARVEREASIETPEQAKEKTRSKRDLSSLFSAAAIAGSYLLLHNVPGHGKIGKGPNCVVDHGTHIYIPPNATAAHLQQVAQLARAKGWDNVAVFKANGRSLHDQVTAQLQQVAPHLGVCTDRHQAGSLYSCRRAAILDHIAARQRQHSAMPEQATRAPQEAAPQPA